MKKSNFAIIAIIVVICIIIAIIVYSLVSNSRKDSNLSYVNSQEDLNELINKIYTESGVDTSGLQTNAIDVTDETLVQSYTGINKPDTFEYMAVSEPLINARAYSLVIAKVKDNVNADEIAKEISENINMRKWICVSAEKLYTASSGNIVFLIMTEEEMAEDVYDGFKKIAGNVGKEFEKEIEEDTLPDDTVTLDVPITNVE